MSKLVLADVDGTMLKHGQEEASPRVVDVVKRLLAAGNRLVPVTSRTINYMGPLATQLELRDLGVLDGGATVFDFLWNAVHGDLSRRLAPEKTAAILQAITPHCVAGEVYYGDDSTVFRGEDAITRDSPAVFAVYPSVAADAVHAALSTIGGISAESNAYEGTTTHSCVQVVVEGVSKESGVRLLLDEPQYATFRPEDIVAIGDGRPDRKLLTATPNGAHRIAMGDHPDLLAAANAIAPPASEDGFASAMERFVLR